MRASRRPFAGLAPVQLAVLFFGLAGVLGKLTGLPSALIVLGRVVFATPALFIMLRLRGETLRTRHARHTILLVAQGGLLALHWTAFFQAINVSTVAIGLLSFSSFPLFTAVLEPALLRQRASAAQVLGALCVLPGVYLLAPGFTLSSAATRGVLWGLLAGATFALLSVSNRWLARSYPSTIISWYQDATAALVLCPVLLFAHPARLFAPRQLALLLILGVLCTAVAHTLFIEGMRHVTAQMASLVATLEPVWGILFALALLGEIPSARTLLGGAIILLGALLPLLAPPPPGPMNAPQSRTTARTSWRELEASQAAAPSDDYSLLSTPGGGSL